jgi:Rod binding domain-containing protein
MSFISSTGIPPSGVSPVPTTNSVAPANQALVPASIRNGDAAAKQAYQTGLGFEQMLVDQLTQQLAATATGSSDGSSDGSDDGSSDGSASGLMGSDPASNMYSMMLPTAMTSGLMSSGGTGLALQFAKALDPSIGAPQSTAGSTGGTPAAGTPSIAGTPSAAGSLSTGGAPITAAPFTAAPSTGGAAIAAPSTALPSTASENEVSEGPEQGEEASR